MITKQLPQPHFFIFSGLIFIKKYLPETVMIHREQQAEPHFGTPPPAFSSLFLNSSPSLPLSKFYQTVISKSGVICALPRGGTQLKLCLAQIRDTQKLLAPPGGLHHASLPSNFFIFVTVPLSLSLSFFFSSIFWLSFSLHRLV